MKTSKFYVAAGFGLLLLGSPFPSLMAQAPTYTVPTSPTILSEDSPQLVTLDQVLCQALSLSETEAQYFLPLFQRYQRALDNLRKKHPFLSSDTAILDASVTEEEAWLSVASLMGYEKANARLQRKMAHRLNRLLPPRKVAQFFLLERQANPIAVPADNEMMTILETN